uniref:CUB and sushi domain-containing protein 2-like n=1 Tax=Crassostrea virginica TaxID=6565 RepID=A0A8B8AUJ7_CRAVI|nr:CUB and sushi domain-containing protein 2-like [Crassostrea virginica]
MTLNSTCKADGTWTSSASVCPTGPPECPVDHPDANLTNVKVTSTSIGTTLSYTCHWNKSMTLNSTCKADGTWTSSASVCPTGPPECPVDHPDANLTNVKVTSTSIGTTLSYTCHWNKSMTLNSTCKADGTWTSSASVCPTGPPECPVDHPDANLTNVKVTSTSIGTTLSYTCHWNKSMTLNSTCKADGTWTSSASVCPTGPPECPVDHPDANLTNVKVTSTSIGTTLSYTCHWNKSMTLNSTCKADGTWTSSASVCPTGPPECPVDHPDANLTNVKVTSTSIGTTLSYTCHWNKSMTLNSTCKADGTWTSSASVCPTGPPECPVDHPDANLTNVKVTSTSIGTTLSYTCHWNKSMTLNSTCKADGTWTSSASVCPTGPPECPVDHPDANLTNVKVTSTSIGTTLSYTCHWNKSMTLNSTCKADGTWTSSASVCPTGPPECPVDHPDANLTNVKVTSTSIGTTLSYTCHWNKSMTLNSTCKADGTWTSSASVCPTGPPECPVDHPDANLTNVKVTSTSIGTTLSYTCHWNKSMTLNSTCKADGTWTSSASVCPTGPPECPVDHPDANLTNVKVTSTSIGTTLSYTCHWNKSMTLNSTCKADGTWTSSASVCPTGPPECPVDHPDANLTNVKVTSTSIGTTLSYTCHWNKSMTLNSTCKADGTWTSSASVCPTGPPECPVDHPDANLTNVKVTSTSIGTTLSYTTR